MNWKKSDETRWNNAERDRVSRMFRHHVRNPSHPRGRIHREACHWHPNVVGEAHHLDYAHPWRVVWAGGEECGCHRRIDHGSLKVPQRAIWDYSSLIEAVAKPGLRRTKRRNKHEVEAERRRRELVPF